MKNSHHGPDEYLSTISLTINKNPSQLGAKASEGGPFPLHHPVSPDLPAWPPAAAVAPVLLRNFAGGRHCDLQGPRARCDRESMGTCWKMMINYGCGQGFEGECVFLDEVIWADVPTFLKIRDFVRDD